MSEKNLDKPKNDNKGRKPGYLGILKKFRLKKDLTKQQAEKNQGESLFTYINTSIIKMTK